MHRPTIAKPLIITIHQRIHRRVTNDIICLNCRQCWPAIVYKHESHYIQYIWPIYLKRWLPDTVTQWWTDGWSRVWRPWWISAVSDSFLSSELVAGIKLRKQSYCRISVIARLMLSVDYRKANRTNAGLSCRPCVVRLFLKVLPQHIATLTSSQSLEVH